MPATRAPARRRWTLSLGGGASGAGRRLELAAGRPLILGVVNLTPDSFSDGGVWYHPEDPERAVAHALRLLEEGADLVDLGAESTRPGGGVYGAGAREVPEDEEIGRLLPVIERLRALTDRPISVDTRKGAVAGRALAAGADLVNDVSALGDPAMGEVVAAAGCPLVLMHSRGELGSMQKDIRFADVVGEVGDELAAAVERARAAGIDEERLVVDPGLGFGKTAEQNLELLSRLPELGRLGRPVLVGASRKSFLGAVVEQPGAPAEPPRARLPGSLAAAAWAAAGGAAIVRVHDVAETARFLKTWAAIDDAGAAGSGSRGDEGHG